MQLIVTVAPHVSVPVSVRAPAVPVCLEASAHVVTSASVVMPAAVPRALVPPKYHQPSHAPVTLVGISSWTM